MSFQDNNPMQHPEEQQATGGDAPRFGRLLAVLIVAVAVAALLAVSAQSYLGG